MLRWSRARGRQGAIGPFFVGKKSSNGTVKQRLVFDTRGVNCDFLPPPSTKLATAGAVSRIEALDGLDLFIASGDLKCCFYHLHTNDELNEHFSLPTIRAKWLGLTSLEGHPVAPEELIFPRLTVLPVGWSWSLHLCQMVTAFALIRAGVPLERSVQDVDPGANLNVNTAVVAAAYVVNYAVLGHDPVAVDFAL